jgi:hypothetical protein
MTYRECIETQIRTATDRLIIVPPAEQPGYLTQIARLAGRLTKKKRSPRYRSSGVSNIGYRKATPPPRIQKSRNSTLLSMQLQG